MANCEGEQSCNQTQDPVEFLVRTWGYSDLIYEPKFDPLPYGLHIFMGIILTVLGKFL